MTSLKRQQFAKSVVGFVCLLSTAANGSGKLEKLIPSKELTIDSYCASVSTQCMKMTGSITCRGKASRDQIQLNEEYAYGAFPFLLERVQCCGPEDSQCERAFSKIKFKVIDGDGDRSAYFDFGKNQLELKNSLFIKCLDTSCVERVILHELGHGCQLAQSQSIPTYANDNSNLFKKVLGNNIWTCVKKAVNENPRLDGIFGEERSQRESEAFADVIFGGLVSSSLSHAYDCFNYPDSSHPTNRSYMHCMHPFAELGYTPSKDWKSIQPPMRKRPTGFGSLDSR